MIWQSMGREVEAFPRPFLVGLAGAAGAGKTTVARALVNAAILRGYVAPVQVHVGAPLKAMMAALYAASGLSSAEAFDRIDGPLKRTPCPILGGRTPTEAQQWLGTDWGRDMIASDLWLGIWRARAAAILPSASVINESVRFEDEAAAIRDMGGVVIRLTGRASDLSGSSARHSSEAGVVPDFEVANLGTPAQAAEEILRLIEARVE